MIKAKAFREGYKLAVSKDIFNDFLSGKILLRISFIDEEESFDNTSFTLSYEDDEVYYEGDPRYTAKFNFGDGDKEDVTFFVDAADFKKACKDAGDSCEFQNTEFGLESDAVSFVSYLDKNAIHEWENLMERTLAVHEDERFGYIEFA